MADIFMRVAAASLFMSVFICGLLLLNPLLRKRYRTNWRGTVWLVIALRLLLPFGLDFGRPLVTLELPDRPPQAPVITEEPQIINDFTDIPPRTIVQRETPRQFTAETSHAPAVQAPAAANAPGLLDVAANIWIIGIGAFLTFQTASYLFFLHRLKSSKKSTFPGYAHKTPDIFVTDAVSVPVLIGLFKPKILLPHADFSEEEAGFIILHELAHLRRKDLLRKMVLMLANAVHWFNPFVYLMCRQAAKDIELACDEEAVRTLDTEARSRYGSTILAAIPTKRRAAPMFSTNFNGSKKDMKSRIANLFDTTKRRRGIGLLCVTVAAALIVTGLVAFGHAPEAELDFDRRAFLQNAMLGPGWRNEIDFLEIEVTGIDVLILDSGSRTVGLTPSENIRVMGANHHRDNPPDWVTWVNTSDSLSFHGGIGGGQGTGTADGDFIIISVPRNADRIFEYVNIRVTNGNVFLCGEEGGTNLAKSLQVNITNGNAVVQNITVRESAVITVDGAEVDFRVEIVDGAADRELEPAAALDEIGMMASNIAARMADTRISVYIDNAVTAAELGELHELILAHPDVRDVIYFTPEENMRRWIEGRHGLDPGIMYVLQEHVTLHGRFDVYAVGSDRVGYLTDWLNSREMIRAGVLSVDFGLIAEVTFVRENPVTSGNVFIAEIAPGQAIPIARIAIGGGNSYSINITAEDGMSIFTGLRDHYSADATSDGLWFQFTGRHTIPYSATIPFTFAPHLMPDGMYYLYVGSTGDRLANVNISVSGTGKGAEIEFLPIAPAMLENSAVFVNENPVASGSVFIAEIAANEAIPIARLVIEGDNSYSVEITAAEYGAHISSGLRTYYSNPLPMIGPGTWYNRRQNYQNPHHSTFPYDFFHIPDGVYYLYVGTGGFGGDGRQGLTNVIVNISGTGSSAEIEFLPITAGREAAAQEAAKPPSLIPIPDVQEALMQSDWIWRRGAVRTEILHGSGDMVTVTHEPEGNWDRLEIVNHINVSTGNQPVTGFVFSDSVISPRNINVHLSAGESGGVTVRADSNLADYLDIRQEGTRLLISPKEGYFLQSGETIDIHITSPGLRELAVVGHVDVSGEIKTDDIIVNALGIIDIDLDITAEYIGMALQVDNVNLSLDAGNITLNIRRAWTLRLSGRAENLLTDISSLRNFDISNLELDAENVWIIER